MNDIDHAFTVFVAETSVRLRRTAYLLCGDRELAQDLLQTAYARTYAAWRRVRRDDAEAYTRRVLVNAHIDWYRRHPWRESTALTMPENTPAVDDPAGLAADRLVIVNALRRLTARERSVVVLRYYADQSEAQTADMLNVSIGTVKKTAHVALTRLRASASLTGLDPVHLADDTGTDEICHD